MNKPKMNEIKRLEKARDHLLTPLAICVRDDRRDAALKAITEVDRAIAELEPKPPVEKGGIYKVVGRGWPLTRHLCEVEKVEEARCLGSLYQVASTSSEVRWFCYNEWTFTRLVEAPDAGR